MKILPNCVTKKIPFCVPPLWDPRPLVKYGENSIKNELRALEEWFPMLLRNFEIRRKVEIFFFGKLAQNRRTLSLCKVMVEIMGLGSTWRKCNFVMQRVLWTYDLSKCYARVVQSKGKKVSEKNIFFLDFGHGQNRRRTLWKNACRRLIWQTQFIAKTNF